MPRIEIIPNDFNDNETGDGTPTFDVCSFCACDYSEGDHHADGTIGDCDVVHPEYDDDDFREYTCEDCGTTLTSDDD